MRARTQTEINSYTKQAVACIKAGDFDQADEFVRLGASENTVIFEYARRGHVKKVDEMLAVNRSLIDIAVRGYALRQDIVQVEFLLLRGGDRMVAVRAYADVLRPDLIELATIRHVYSFSDVIQRYKDALHFCSGAKVLRILTLTSSIERRKRIAAQAHASLLRHDKAFLTPVKREDNINNIMLNKAERARSLMKKYQLKVDEATALMEPNISGAVEWMLQGDNFINGKLKLPFDIFIMISSYVFGISTESTKRLHGFLCKYTFEGALQRTNLKYQTNYPHIFFRKNAEHQDKVASLKSRYSGNRRKGL